MATTCRCHLQIRLFDLLIFAKFRVAHFAKINHTANLEKDERIKISVSKFFGIFYGNFTFPK